MAAAIGRSIDIPIIVRSLGHDLYRFGLRPTTRFRPGVELLIYIDGNLSSFGVDDPNLRVENFLLSWWSASTRPKNHSSYLSFSTLSAALAQHRTHLSNPDLTKSSRERVDLTAELNKPTYSWHPEALAELDNPCTRCRLYRAVSLGAADKLRDVINRVHGLEIASQGEGDIGMRRASTFYELYDTVLKKEVDSETMMGSGAGLGSGSAYGSGRTFTKDLWGGKKGKGKAKEVSAIVETIREQAEEQWRELARDPGELSFKNRKSKWTWGVELDSNDIWQMIRGADKQCQIPHSGYDDELATGKLRSSSPIPSPNAIADIDDPNTRFDALSHDFPFIRDLCPEEIPIAFAFPTLHYRAFGETESGSVAKSPPLSGSEYVAVAEERNARERKKRVMQNEANDPEQPSTSDSASIISKGSPPRRPWLGPPPHGYVRPPMSYTRPTKGMTKHVISEMTVGMGPYICSGRGSKKMSDPDSSVDPESDRDGVMNLVAPDLSDEDLSIIHSGEDAMDLGMRSEIPLGDFGLVEPDPPDDSDEEIPVNNCSAEDIPVGHYGLIAPDLPDNSDEERPIENYGLVAPDLPGDSDEEIGRYGLVTPHLPDDADEENSLNTLGLVVPDLDDDSDEDMADRYLRGNTGDWDMRSDSVYEEYESDASDDRARARVRIPLPRVNPATGQYTADSFFNVPNEWLD